MGKKVYLIVPVAVLMLFSSFCRAGSVAGDAYLKGIELAAQGNLQEAKDSLSHAISDESFKSFAQMEIDDK